MNCGTLSGVLDTQAKSKGRLSLQIFDFFFDIVKFLSYIIS